MTRLGSVRDLTTMNTRVLLTLALLAASAVLAACGGSLPTAPAAPADPTATASAGVPSGGDSKLTIVYNDGNGKTSTWQLSCTPTGGNHPDPTGACAALTEHAASALPKVSAGRMCTQVYGGPQTAVLTGSWLGEPVDSRLSRNNGCEISRWNALVGLLPRVGA